MKNLKKILLLLFICGVFGDEVLKVMEGDSVTLDSNLTEIQKYRHILWRFDSELIAHISDGKISYKPGPDGRFGDRLQLDSETGSLTITNMRMKHSGLYKLEASSTSGTTYKRFSVSVYESPSAIPVEEVELVSESVMEGKSLTLHTVVLHPHDELIVWRFGKQGKLIAKADFEAKDNSLHDIDERFSDRLKLNNQDGSLTINNMRNTDSGLYIVKISSSSSKQTSHKRFIVTVIVEENKKLDPGLSSDAKAGIVVVVVLLVMILAAVAGIFYYRWKESEQKRQMSEMSKDLKKLSEISEQLSRNCSPFPEISEDLKKLLEENKKLGRAQSYKPELSGRAQSYKPQLPRTQSAELIQPPTISEELKKLRTDQSNTPDQC